MGQKITDLDIHEGAVWCETEGASLLHSKYKYMSSPASYGRMFAFDAEGQYLLTCGSERGFVYKVRIAYLITNVQIADVDRNVLVNFEPGEYMRKRFFQSATQAAGKNKSDYL